MRIIVGGCGSSGTTLIKNILNEHPEIHCGEEASFFDRLDILNEDLETISALMQVDHYHALDSRMIFPIIRPTTAGPRSQFGLCQARWEELWPTTNRDKLITEIDSGKYTNLSEVFHMLLAREADANGKVYWAEKTPGNIFTMQNLINYYPDVKLIVCLRNPWDTIASLIFNRNFDVFSSICRWTMSTIQALSLANEPNIQFINYDLLCSEESDLVVKDLWEFLDVDPGSPTMHGAKLPTTAQKTWLAYKDRISPGMIESVDLATHDLWKSLTEVI